MQSEEDNSLHKLAVLVSHLSPDAASALLAELPPAIAALVRNQAKQTGNINPLERDAILREFREHCEQQITGSSEWDALSANLVAAVLENERPCIVAALLTQFSEPKAGLILAELPAELGNKALRLIPKRTLPEHVSTASFEALKRQVVELEAEQVASRQMSSIARIATEEVATRDAQRVQSGVAWPPVLEEQGGFGHSNQPPQRVVDPPIVVSRAPEFAQPQTVETRSSDAHVAESETVAPCPNPVAPCPNTVAPCPNTVSCPNSFESIVELEPQVIEAILADLPAETVLVAIAGATPQFASRLQQLIHADDWNHLNSGISQLGAIRLEDIDYAQSVVLDAAQELLIQQNPQSNSTTLRRAG